MFAVEAFLVNVAQAAEDPFPFSALDLLVLHIVPPNHSQLGRLFSDVRRTHSRGHHDKWELIGLRWRCRHLRMTSGYSALT